MSRLAHSAHGCWQPNDAPKTKVLAVKGYGADVTQVPHEERSSTVQRLIAEHGMTLVHPSNDPGAVPLPMCVWLLHPAHTLTPGCRRDERPGDHGARVFGASTGVDGAHT